MASFRIKMRGTPSLMTPLMQHSAVCAIVAVDSSLEWSLYDCTVYILLNFHNSDAEIELVVDCFAGKKSQNTSTVPFVTATLDYPTVVSTPPAAHYPPDNLPYTIKATPYSTSSTTHRATTDSSIMGMVSSVLYWEKEAKDGTTRSTLSQVLDPIGACLQPASFNLYNPEENMPAVDDMDMQTESNDALEDTVEERHGM